MLGWGILLTLSLIAKVIRHVMENKSSACRSKDWSESRFVLRVKSAHSLGGPLNGPCQKPVRWA